MTYEPKPAIVTNPTAQATTESLLEHGPDVTPASRSLLSTRHAQGSPPGVSTAQQAAESLRWPSAAGLHFPGDEAERPSWSSAVRTSSGVTRLFACFARFSFLFFCRFIVLNLFRIQTLFQTRVLRTPFRPAPRFSSLSWYVPMNSQVSSVLFSPLQR